MKQRVSMLAVFSVLFILIVVGFLGCSLDLLPETGVLEIQLGGSSKSVNWLPEIDMEIDSYTIKGTGPNSGDSFQEEGFPGGVFIKESLSVGAWEIVIDGYNEDAIKIATTTINLTIRKSQTAQATATMRPLVGTGTLDISVTWTDSQDKLADPQVYVLIQDEHGDELSAYSEPIRLTLGEDGKSASETIGEIPTGWYEVVVGLYEGIAEGEAESVWQYIHSLRIVKDETTKGVLEIPEAEILFGLGRITLDLNEEMSNPFGLSFAGLPESIKEEQEVTVTAAGTYGDDAVYRWYVSGVRQNVNTSDFVFVSNSTRLFDINLMVNSGGAVAGFRQSVEVVKATEEVASDIAALAIEFTGGDSTASVTNNVVLTTSGSRGTRITWESNNPLCIDTTGTVVRPAYLTGDAQVQLTATVERGTAIETRVFSLNVVKLPQNDAEAVAADKAALEVSFAGLDSADNVTQNVILASSGASGTTITWQSSIPQTISNAGIVTRPDYTGESDVQVILTATISKGAASETKTFILTVKIVLLEQTVTYETNGGSELLPKTVYWGRLIDEPVAPTKVGCSFEGWFTDSGLTERWDFAQDYVSEDFTLFAKWDSGYRISFNSQGGLTPNPTTINIGYGMEYGVLATTTRAGHTFLGWHTEPGGAGSLITADTKVAINEDHTLYAAWQVNTYSITFDSRGGTLYGPNSKEVTYGHPYGDLPVPAKDKYVFAGWWTGIDESGTQIYEDTTFNVLIDRTLYAKWFFDVFQGPAGGFVFYENPHWETDGWRYLEAAPYGWYDGDTHSMGAYSGDEDPYFQFGADHDTGPHVNPTAIGMGVANTAIIVQHHDTLFERFPEKGDFYTNPTAYYERNDGTVAAKICAEYSVAHDGITYADWFLPSKEELNLMYQNLILQNLGGFSSINYWSSSGYLSSYAWTQEVNSGRQSSSSGRSSKCRVRPIRAFR